MFTCDSGTCVSRDKLCDYSDDCFDSSDESYGMCSTYVFRCDFEAGLCSAWTEEVTDNADWVLFSGSSDAMEMLPGYDHTTLSSSGTRFGVVAVDWPGRLMWGCEQDFRSVQGFFWVLFCWAVSIYRGCF